MENEFVTYGTARVMISQTTPDRAERLAGELRGIEGVFSVDFDEAGGDWRGSDALLSVTFDGPETDETVLQAMDAVREAAAPYDAYISTTIGVSMADTLDSEMQVILVIAAVIIVAVLTLTSRSYAEVPVLILTFAAAALLNMGTNFLCGEISFVSNSVSVVLQLALAIDYAIVVSTRYNDCKAAMPPKQAIVEALNLAFPTILTSGSILSAAAFLIGCITTQPYIAGIGECLCRGTLISIFLVLFILPQILVLGDAIVERTRFALHLPAPRKQEVRGAVRVDGRVRGYVHGYVDGTLHGTIRGDAALQVAAGQMGALPPKIDLPPDPDASPHPDTQEGTPDETTD